MGTVVGHDGIRLDLDQRGLIDQPRHLDNAGGGANLAENLAEYLLHENRLLAPRDELNALREGIARLNGELARVESRLASIKR
jgi:ubiquinone biosynthesis protein UbiJ